MSITIRKIARDLNIAVSTVSKALRDSHEISSETKKRILDYARQVNYVPNAYAGSLKNRRTKNIAVVLPEVADSFFSDSINGIESVAETKGYHVMVYLTHENPFRETSILKELINGRVDGILISVSSGVAADSEVHAEVARRVPMVFFDRVCDDVEAVKVVTNDFDSAVEATKLIIKNGARNIAFLSLEDGPLIVSDRLSGFIQAHKQRGLHVKKKNIVSCSHDPAANVRRLRQLFSGREKVDGVVASVEKLGMQVYAVCRDAGLSIPDDVRLIAFSSLQAAPFLSPSLSTITQPAFEMGRVAASQLFGRLSGRNAANEKIVLPSLLQERESSG